jgi:hypothetical protein
MHKIFLFFSCLGFCLFSCAPTQFVVPLEKGEHAVNASLGGPLVDIPGIATIPIPFTSLGYGYGLTEKSTISGALYPTAALYGNFQLSAGYTRELWKKNRMNISAKAGFDYMIDVYEKNQRIWPQLDANFSFTHQNLPDKGKRKLVYAGFSNWFELNTIKAHEESQSSFLFFNPHLGYQMKKNNWAFHFELAFLAPNLRNDKVVLDYKSIFGNRGATGIYFGLQYHIK